MRPRSKVWILFGVLIAAVVGGGLGMLAFQWTAPESRNPEPSPSATAPSGLPPAPSGVATTPQSATPAPVSVPSSTPGVGVGVGVEKQAVLKVTTDPSGASIREDGREICVATPCDLVFKGEAADAAKVHKLLIMRGGFRPEQRVVKTSDPPVHVKLSHAGGGGRPAAPTPSAKPDATVNGFKDVPY